MASQDDKEAKNAEFLSTKVNLREGEELKKSFSCALVDKIVLQGRIFITTERICFYSKFNASNVFFGGTFIQIPKGDIKKAEKKKNSFFLDNMICLTTVNGEVTFTSLFSRDEAYDLVCKTYSISLDDDVYEFEESENLGLPEFLVDLEQEDDLKPDEAVAREGEIRQQLQKFAYQQAVSEVIEKEGLTALKVFKLFFSSETITIGKRSYSSFLEYFKAQVGHKDMEVSEF